ncbi:hypothetical protein EYF80_039970 [Liparis tanakae]|uniref:Secreted protein n=1 Tax=Liparis tanakae TaxID=230148 RepID=A0A4Z2G8F0_9TELE|nr:hypothetical protein EYF80_039970 [Liparis tanakae]
MGESQLLRVSLWYVCLLSVCSRRLSRDDDSELQLMVSLELDVLLTLSLSPSEKSDSDLLCRLAEPLMARWPSSWRLRRRGGASSPSRDDVRGGPWEMCLGLAWDDVTTWPCGSYGGGRLTEPPPRSDRSLSSAELSLGGSMVSSGRWSIRRRCSWHSREGVLRQLVSSWEESTDRNRTSDSVLDGRSPDLDGATEGDMSSSSMNRPPEASGSGPSSPWRLRQFSASSIDSASDFTCLEKASSSSVMASVRSPCGAGRDAALACWRTSISPHSDCTTAPSSVMDTCRPSKASGSSAATWEYLFVLQVSGELVALGERARPLDGLLLRLLPEDGLRVLELGPTGPLRTRLDPVAVERAVEAVRTDGRAVGHGARAEAGSAVQGRAALIGPSVAFHTATRSEGDA